VRGEARCRILRADGRAEVIGLTIRLDTPEDIAYWRHGGILPFVWREMMGRAGQA
jgi:aconitate hydratase